MTIVAGKTSAKRRYYQMRDRHIAAGGIVPQAVYHLALEHRYEDAITWLKDLQGSTATWGEGKFAAEVPPLTEQAQAAMRNAALANLAAEVHDAGPEQLAHFARMAEALCRTDLGARMQNVIDDERTRQVFTLALLPVPPTGDKPQAGPGPAAELPIRVPVLFAAVAARLPQAPRRGDHGLGFQFWAARQERWEQAGQVGDPSDPEFDDVFFQAAPGGEGGS